jgi:RNA 3'-phosphate cyclase
MSHIRANRSKPGLRPQHLAAVRLAAQLCSAELLGDEVNSGALEFRPSKLRPGRYRQEIGTAGSLVLLTQAALVPALAAGGQVVLELLGGTDVPMAPPLDFLAEVVLPYYRRLGQIELEVLSRGFHPKGGGRVRLTVQGHGNPPEALNLVGTSAWGEVEGRAVAGEQLRGPSVAERMAAAARLLTPCNPQEEYVESASAGAVLTLWCRGSGRWTGASTLGRQGMPSERVGKETATRLRGILADPRPADEHLSDQLVPLLALVGGKMECQTISSHCSTNIDICSLFTGTRFTVEGTTVTATPP